MPFFFLIVATPLGFFAFSPKRKNRKKTGGEISFDTMCVRKNLFFTRCVGGKIYFSRDVLAEKCIFRTIRFSHFSRSGKMGKIQGRSDDEEKNGIVTLK